MNFAEDTEHIKIVQEQSFGNLSSQLELSQEELIEAMKVGRIAVLEKRLAATKDAWRRSILP